MDIIYHSTPTTWKNKIIEQGFNYADSTIKELSDFFETGVENLELKEENKKSSVAAKKAKEKKSLRKRKQADTDSKVIESSEETSVEYRQVKEYQIHAVKGQQIIKLFQELWTSIKILKYALSKYF